MPRSCAARTTTGSIPGDTRYAAPASAARSTCSGRDDGAGADDLAALGREADDLAQRELVVVRSAAAPRRSRARGPTRSSRAARSARPPCPRRIAMSGAPAKASSNQSESVMAAVPSSTKSPVVLSVSAARRWPARSRSSGLLAREPGGEIAAGEGVACPDGLDDLDAQRGLEAFAGRRCTPSPRHPRPSRRVRRRRGTARGCRRRAARPTAPRPRRGR